MITKHHLGTLLAKEPHRIVGRHIVGLWRGTACCRCRQSGCVVRAELGSGTGVVGLWLARAAADAAARVPEKAASTALPTRIVLTDLEEVSPVRRHGNLSPETSANRAIPQALELLRRNSDHNIRQSGAPSASPRPASSTLGASDPRDTHALETVSVEVRALDWARDEDADAIAQPVDLILSVDCM